ncbi:MAG: hypothetical protein JO227_01110 [Acetobacteraceae bacterium]|nr:hypothetical protein [Acetobacteraceae bacterium]
MSLEGLVGLLAAYCCVLLFAAAWLLHVITCVNEERWLLLACAFALLPLAVLRSWGKHRDLE